MSKILIIEDDVVLAKMYAKKFISNGHEVVLAFTGGEGQVAIAREKPDLILLDIMLPAVDGFSLIRQWKKDPQTADMAIVILTNLGTSKILIDEARHLGVKNYLIKYKTSTKDVISVVEKELSEGQKRKEGNGGQRN